MTTPADILTADFTDEIICQDGAPYFWIAGAYYRAGSDAEASARRVEHAASHILSGRALAAKVARLEGVSHARRQWQRAAAALDDARAEFKVWAGEVGLTRAEMNAAVARAEAIKASREAMAA